MEFDSAYFSTFYRNYFGQNPPRKLDFYLRTIERFTPRRPDLAWLDVGCGLGAFLGHLAARRSYRLFGTDVSAYALEQNRQRLPSVEFSQASAEEVAFPAEQFDVLTAMDVIEHVADLHKVRDAFLTLLKPGGVACVVVPVYDGLSGPVIRALDRDPTHVHKEPRQFWLDWASTGFELQYWTGIVRYFFPFGYYLHVPAHWLRRHTPAVLLVLRKPSAL